MAPSILPEDHGGPLPKINQRPKRVAVYRCSTEQKAGTGGVRKARWGRGGRGKSGGVRAIYYFRIGQYAVYMRTLYAKSGQTDLTEDDKRDMKKIVSWLKGRALQ